jgi:hypothetical protein
MFVLGVLVIVDAIATAVHRRRQAMLDGDRARREPHAGWDAIAYVLMHSKARPLCSCRSGTKDAQVALSN